MKLFRYSDRREKQKQKAQLQRAKAAVYFLIFAFQFS